MNTNNNQEIEWSVTQSDPTEPSKEEATSLPEVDTREKRYHKHVIAIPLAMAALLHLHFGTHSATPAVLLTGSLLGSSTEHIAEDREVRLPFNGSARVHASAMFHVSAEKISLEDGSVLVKAGGPIRIVAGNITILLVRGSAVLSFSDGTLTVAALTAPVVLEQYGDRQLLPAGYQWRGEELTLEGMFAIPADYLLEQESHVRTLSSVSPKPFITLPSWNFGLLPGAERRKEEAKALLLEQEVEEALLQKNETAATKLFQQMPQEEQSNDGIGAVLGMQELPSIAFVTEVLKTVEDADLALLLSAHPELEPAFTGTISSEDTRTWMDRVFLSDYGVVALSEHAKLRSESYLRQALISAKDQEAKSAVLSPVILQLTRTASRASAVTLPERANALLGLAERLSRGYEEVLSDEAKQALASLGTIDRPEIVSEVIATESSSSASSDTSVPSDTSDSTADLVINSTNAMLNSLHAMRSIETKVEAIAPYTAKVSGVYFAGGAGDNGVEFLYNTQKQEMYDIRLNGKLQPFPMDLEAFTKWVQRK